MDRRTKIGASIAAGVSAVVAVAAIAVASPETGAQTADSTPNPSTSTAPQDGSGKGMSRPQETPLTGAALEDATAAAKAAVPGGTILRVETDGDGGAAYEAHVRKADGTEVVVKMDKEFKVTGVEAFTGRGGPGGHRDGDGPRGAQDGSGSGSSSSAAPSSTNGA